MKRYLFLVLGKLLTVVFAMFLRMPALVGQDSTSDSRSQRPATASQPVDNAGEAKSALGFFADDDSAFVDLDGLPEDPFFDRYLPLGELSDAWEAMNSNKLTDLAIQAAEGERVLLRGRHGLSTDSLWQIALRAAEVQGNGDALKRLETAADRSGMKEFQDRLQAAVALAGESRAADEATTINPLEVSAEDFVILKEYSRSIEGAAVRGDSRYLQDIKNNLDTLFSKAPALRKFIESLLKRPLTKTTIAPLEPKVVGKMDKLLADSRYDPLKDARDKRDKLRRAAEAERARAAQYLKEREEAARKAAETEARRAAELTRQRAEAAKKAAQAEADRLSEAAKEAARNNISITAEWQYQALVPDPYRLINFAVREMYYDTTANRLMFQVIGRVPIRADGSAKIPGRISASLKADMDVDYFAEVVVDFSSEAARITAQPRVITFTAQLNNVRFNADLANWFRGRIQDSLNRKVQSENPRVQRFIEDAVASLNLTYDGQAQLRSIAERIRDQLPAARSGTINVGVGSIDDLIGTWQTDGRTVSFDRDLATIRTNQGLAQFRYSFDPTTGIMVGVDANGVRTETYIRWLSTNSIEWKSPTGQRHYVKVTPPSIARPAVPNRIDLRDFGSAIGGVVEEHLKQQYANYWQSDSGREAWRPYDN